MIRLIRNPWLRRVAILWSMVLVLPYFTFRWGYEGAKEALRHGGSAW